MDISKYIKKARDNKMRLWLLNKILYRAIPFNKPHKFYIRDIGEDHVEVTLPYRKRNLNHIKGLHACAMATLAEYATGFLLLTKLNPKEYRIIMKRIEMDYHYQGKMEAYCRFELSDDDIKARLLEPLKTEEAITIKCEPKIYDKEGNHLATGHVYWQVKSWQKVRTKLS